MNMKRGPFCLPGLKTLFLGQLVMVVIGLAMGVIG